MVKFLHTADWHLGLKYKQLGDKAQHARDIRLKTAQKILTTARDNDVDFILIAGDLLDSNQVDRKLVGEVSQLFQQVSPIPVYLLPGNHDPLTRDSLYHDPVWESVDNLTIFQENKPVVTGNCTLYPCPVIQKQSREDPTEWINTPEESNQLNIGVAHGNLQVGFIEEANFPIPPDRTQISGLDYLALGEWHSLFQHHDREGINRTVYPGTPETTKFGEDDSGKIVLVEIKSANDTPLITPLDVGNLSWLKLEKKINTLADARYLESELESIPEPENQVIYLQLSGVTDQETISYLSQLEDHYHDYFLKLQVSRDELYLKPNLLELKALIPEGAVVNQTFEALTALMKTQPEIQDHADISSLRTQEIFNQLRDQDLVEGLSPEILNRAFLLMYQMIKEASP
ncbi:MAG: DNA repair exonuclease [Methanobacterium sp.]|nr:DNA repair exonuclease [Methanobacterium sp.]